MLDIVGIAMMTTFIFQSRDAKRNRSHARFWFSVWLSHRVSFFTFSENSFSSRSPSLFPLSHLFPLFNYHPPNITMADLPVYDGAIGIDLGRHLCQTTIYATELTLLTSRHHLLLRCQL